jgi:TrmH family RNA methyltransferase
MISAKRIKQIKALSQKKNRRDSGFFVVEGDKAVNELLEQSDWEVSHIFAVDTWLDENSIPHDIPFDKVTAKELTRISSLTTPNRVLAIVKIPGRNITEVNPDGKLILLLDNIQDPGNLGTIIRTADWFGIENIVCSENTVELYNPKVIQSSMGSFLRVKLYYTSSEDFLSKLPKELPVLGALLKGENIYNSKLPDEGIIIIGNESKGISAKLINYITHKIYIPAHCDANKKIQPESLNASVATGIILSHIRSQQSI